MLGVGWNVEGLSTITRCPRTLAQDGAQGGINYDLNDRYCLDGERLIAISGNYGVDGTEYRTERESFSKIVSSGSAGNGPASFKVWTKTGQVLEYGNTTDSRIEAQGRTSVAVWALNRASDVKGNYFTASYFEDTANGEWRVTRIDYTGNTAAKVAPANSIRFVYETRTDRIERTVSSARISTTVRLAFAQTFAGANLVREYRLGYEYSAATSYSRLVSVQECSATGPAALCLLATRFTWTNSTLNVQNFSWTGGHGVGDAGWRLVDLFGTGRQVYYTHARSGAHFATQFNADGTIRNWTWSGGHGLGDAGWDVVDLFGDGRPVYYTHSRDGRHFATRLNPDGTLQNWTWQGAGVGDAGWHVGNLFGDGRTVYHTHSNNGAHFASRLNADGTVQNWNWQAHGAGDAGSALIDLFGDGRQIYYTHWPNGEIALWGHCLRDRPTLEIQPIRKIWRAHCAASRVASSSFAPHQSRIARSRGSERCRS